ncbi:class I SAM-dependent methyltransferase [Halobaculum magnesiiphilum]|uniref:Class I SAM-dependent methyltransferase n=1 Tax=Halobaculum magnesiiphilum TaxID=1017351 RepID=A0A8T8WDZ9_9EURY|nr:class I SAM-dependent methyltransferase [Halobaculum magnesiiphilum]QZP38097.1 class I SAM-dependent methyltransferase [Halobaculum magnesiiphilum]
MSTADPGGDAVEGDRTDPFGRAIREFARDEQTEPLWCVDGAERVEHPIEGFYFADRDESAYETVDSDGLTAPLLDLGAGAGRDVLRFQERYEGEVVGLEPSAHLVATMRERGVESAVRGDMFALRESFDRDRFRGVYAHGTQLGLARPPHRLREFLADLAFVTTDDAVAVVDNYDPEADGARDLLGWRPDPTPGMGYRVMHFEYEGDVGDTLLFRPFAPDVLREACVGSEWPVATVRYSNDHHYEAVLRKP